jgi:hypothetical protein
MRTTIAALLMLFASPALAGELYGTITEAGKPVGEGVMVEARCGQTSYPGVKTDKSGTYHLVVQEKGKCTLTVKHKNQAPSIEVASYDEGVQVDLVLEQKDGSYALKRK